MSKFSGKYRDEYYGDEDSLDFQPRKKKKSEKRGNRKSGEYDEYYDDYQKQSKRRNRPFN